MLGAAVLQDIVEQAKGRWDIMDVRVIHRVGTLHPTDQIVFVAVALACGDDTPELTDTVAAAIERVALASVDTRRRDRTMSELLKLTQRLE